MAVASQVESSAETSLFEATPDAASATFGDAELAAALESSDLVGEWIAASPVSAQASLIEVLGSEAYDEARLNFLVSLDALGARHQHVVSRGERLNEVTENVDVLEALIRQLRRAVATSDRSPALSLSDTEVARARIALAQMDVRSHWLGFSLDSVSMSEHRLSTAHDLIASEIDEVTTASRSGAKTHGATIARLGHAQDALVDIRELVAIGHERGSQARLALAAERASVVAEMSAVHELRTLSSTSVNGLPLVTVDAYIQGAATLDESCPVDWTLLAGIGRIESRHGTINDSSVQSSGRITQAIYGPLLDGGATAREAEAAVRAAEEAELAAEEEVAEAERVAAKEAFDSSVWGQLQRDEEAANAVSNETDDPRVATATPESESDSDSQASGDENGSDSEGGTDEADAPRYDSQLWGDIPGLTYDLSADDDESDPRDADDEGEDGDEEEDREFKGNGFAVISDSDNGRHDGNASWDRAVGPMQFIPETWSYWETDGNGDGVLDPQNLYDAAASAGRFLCYLSRSRGSSPWTFVLGYNSSDTYVRNVMSAAETFRVAELPDVTGA